MGRLYLNGEGVKKDEEQAERWYKKSVELDGGDFNRCVNGQFPDRCFCTLLFMATRDNPQAMVAVGESYMNSIFHEKTQVLKMDPVKAKDWFVKAARSGTEDGLKAYFFLYYGCKNNLIFCQGPEESEKWKKEGLEKGVNPSEFG